MKRTNFGYNPFEEIEQLFERMSHQFDEMGHTFERSQLPAMSSASAGGFKVDVADYDADVVVTADLPGFEKSDIDISVANQALTIRAERDIESESDADAYVRRERRHESVRRTISLPVDVRESDASATYTNGVLTVTLPKAEIADDAHHIDVE